MKAKVLLEKVRQFLSLLRAHSGLWNQSLSDSWPDKPIRNVDELTSQQLQLFRLYYLIDEYLSLLSKGRTLVHFGTGINWDMYRTAIGNDGAVTKRPSLDNALLDLEGIVAMLENEDPEKEITAAFMPPEAKKVFVCHGRETKALTKLERFLRGLGITPIIVKHEPSLGQAIDDLVEEQMGTCVAAVVLATKDDEVTDEDGSKYFQPRPNVVHEIGLAQEKLRDKIIYLKETGCRFPSNIAPRVWENFTQENMEDAFSKIVKELNAFGIIR